MNQIIYLFLLFYFTANILIFIALFCYDKMHGIYYSGRGIDEDNMVGSFVSAAWAERKRIWGKASTLLIGLPIIIYEWIKDKWGENNVQTL